MCLMAQPPPITMLPVKLLSTDSEPALGCPGVWVHWSRDRVSIMTYAEKPKILFVALTIQETGIRRIRYAAVAEARGLESSLK